MNPYYFEMQALTWRAQPPIQQDAILIGNKVIQHDGLISKRYVYPADEYWCAAVSDGVNSSPKLNKPQNRYSTVYWHKLKPNSAFLYNKFKMI